MYFNNTVMERMIYEPNNDILYILIGVKSEITEKVTMKIIRLSKELYDRTNFVDDLKIYEPE